MKQVDLTKESNYNEINFSKIVIYYVDKTKMIIEGDIRITIELYGIRIRTVNNKINFTLSYKHIQNIEGA